MENIKKIANTLFANVYILILISSIVLVSYWMINLENYQLFDNLTEILFGVLYVGAIILSVFMHLKLVNKKISIPHILSIVITFINLVFSVYTLIHLLTIRSDGLELIYMMVLILVGWLLSLITGFIALKIKSDVVV